MYDAIKLIIAIGIKAHGSDITSESAKIFKKLNTRLYAITTEQIEYIIIDGESTDETHTIVEKYKDNISLYICEKDAGIYDAMNKGIARASGELIGIIKSDDWYEKHAVEHAVRAYNKVGPSLLYGDVYVLGFGI